MGNLILASLLVIFGAGFFKIGYLGGAVREVFYGFQPSMLKCAVSVFNTDTRLMHLGQYVDPYFDANVVVSVVSGYFRKGLVDYQPSSASKDIQYTFEVTCGSYQSLPLVRGGRVNVYPQEVSIRLKHPITATWTFDETRTFKISEVE